MNSKLEAMFDELPVVTVLRYIKPDEVVEIGQALYRAGIRIMEIPLNSPDPFTSIERLRSALGETAIVGAGTVLTVEQVDRLAEVGGEIAVAPNTNTKVISRSIAKGLIPVPGFATATEAFQAYDSGARHLKLFPISAFGVDYIKALGAVLPDDIKLIAVGGVSVSNAAEMINAGANGVGTGAGLYRPGDTAEAVYDKALPLVAAVKAAAQS